MKGVTFTDTATTTDIQNNDILAAFVYSYGPGFQLLDGTSLTFTLNVGDNNPDGEAVGVWTTELTTAILTAQADIAAISTSPSPKWPTA